MNHWRSCLSGLALLLSCSLLYACAPSPRGDDSDDSEGAGGTPGDGKDDEGRSDVAQVCSTSAPGARVLRRLTRGELENTLHDVFPEVASTWSGVELTSDPVSPLGFTTDAATLLVNGPTFKNMLDTAEDLAALVAAPGTFEALLPCAPTADRSCAEELVNRYGMRLFRRPLSADELTRYVDYQQSVSARSDFATGSKWALSVMMQSPHAFYRSEIGVQEGELHKLTGYELATNLAYTYSGTTPTLELLERAGSGEFATAAALQAEAARMLDDPNHRETTRAFFKEWLGYDRALNQSREKEPEFAAKYSPLLVQETEAFIDEVVFGGGTLQELLTANYSMLNGDLAQYYGYGNAAAVGFERAQRPAGHGIGITAQGSLLVTTAHQTETSPTLRGLLFTENFLCLDRPAPPNIIPPLAEAAGIEEAKTTRQKYELHHATGACAGCHRNFDPFGFTLEQFDETGRYRADEAGEPIDTVSVVQLPDGKDYELVGQEDLARLVDETDVIENCVSGLLATYMLSGGGGSGCLAEDARKAVARGEMSLRDYLISLSSAPHFSSRKL